MESEWHGLVAEKMGLEVAKQMNPLTCFTRSAAVELGSLGIRVNAVAAWVVPTENLMAMQKMKDYAKILENVIPLRRLGRVVDIVGPVVFLASDEAQYITGQLIVVAGGLSIQ